MLASNPVGFGSLQPISFAYSEGPARGAAEKVVPPEEPPVKVSLQPPSTDVATVASSKRKRKSSNSK